MITSLNGKEIIPGSYIAYATRYSSSLDMKLGRVLEIVQKPRYEGSSILATKLYIQGIDKNWKGEWTLLKKGFIERIDRVVVLDYVPEEVVILLGSV